MVIGGVALYLPSYLARQQAQFTSEQMKLQQEYNEQRDKSERHLESLRLTSTFFPRLSSESPQERVSAVAALNGVAPRNVLESVMPLVVSHDMDEATRMAALESLKDSRRIEVAHALRSALPLKMRRSEAERLRMLQVIDRISYVSGLPQDHCIVIGPRSSGENDPPGNSVSAIASQTAGLVPLLIASGSAFAIDSLKDELSASVARRALVVLSTDGYLGTMWEF